MLLSKIQRVQFYYDIIPKIINYLKKYIFVQEPFFEADASYKLFTKYLCIGTQNMSTLKLLVPYNEINNLKNQNSDT